jgi:hypothetical protein
MFFFGRVLIFDFSLKQPLFAKEFQWPGAVTSLSPKKEALPNVHEFGRASDLKMEEISGQEKSARASFAWAAASKDS